MTEFKGTGIFSYKSQQDLNRLEYQPLKYNSTFWRKQSKEYLLAEIESMAKEIFNMQKTLAMQQDYFN